MGGSPYSWLLDHINAPYDTHLISSPAIRQKERRTSDSCGLLHYVYICVLKSISNNRLKSEVQLNKYETDPYSLQIFPINMSVCLIIFVFCKSFELICEPDITPVSYQVENLQKAKQKLWCVSSLLLSSISCSSSFPFQSNEFGSSSISNTLAQVVWNDNRTRTIILW